MSVITWDEFFMGVAMLASKRSKDPSTQVGACIVDNENKVVSLGYNGMPRNLDESKLSWNKNEGLDSKYLYVCHAELNAILNVKNGCNLKDCTVYVTLFPCNECAKCLIQVGIKRIVYLSDKYNGTTENLASKKLLDLANIKYEQFNGNLDNIKL